MKHVAAKLLSTCFGFGLFPKAPGTATSLVAVIVYGFVPILHNPLLLLALVLLLTILGVWSGNVMEEHYGEDPSIVTIDELAGQWLALVALPSHGWLPLLLAFTFFRLFDIAKPWIIDKAQHLSGGWGIMADDLLAGLAANLSVQALLFGVAMMYRLIGM